MQLQAAGAVPEGPDPLETQGNRVIRYFFVLR